MATKRVDYEAGDVRGRRKQLEEQVRDARYGIGGINDLAARARTLDGWLFYLQEASTSKAAGFEINTSDTSALKKTRDFLIDYTGRLHDWDEDANSLWRLHSNRICVAAYPVLLNARQEIIAAKMPTSFQTLSNAALRLYDSIAIARLLHELEEKPFYEYTADNSNPISGERAFRILDGMQASGLITRDKDGRNIFSVTEKGKEVMESMPAKQKVLLERLNRALAEFASQVREAPAEPTS